MTTQNTEHPAVAEGSTQISPEVNKLRRSVLGWLATVCVPDATGQYYLNVGADASVFSSCFALFLRHLFQDLQDAAERETWLTWLQSFQDSATGLFVDPENSKRAPDGLHDLNHLNQQLTTFCLSAIHALGGRPRHRLKFVDAWKSPEFVARYLDSLNWANPWNSGNKAMFQGIFIGYAAAFEQDSQALRALTAWFRWHDLHQNKAGFWGSGRQAEYINGMGGAYHQFAVYNFFERPIQYPQAIVDRVLLLQQPDGMFSPYQGGQTCYELDAVDILVNMYRQHDYRRDDIKRCLQLVLDGVLANQNEDGGFCWGKPRAFNPRWYVYLAGDIFRHRSLWYWYASWRAAATIFVRRNPRIRTGWAVQPRPWIASSVFDSWFRCVTIAEIGQVLNDSTYGSFPWQFLQVPGLGWFSQ